MSSSFEKSVKGATKIKNAPPKSKYIEHILVATHSGEAGIGEVFRAIQYRLRDSTWTVVFKSLITVHLMIREGSPDVTLAFIARHRNALAISNFTDAQTQGRNIRHYANYLSERGKSFRDTKTDWVRVSESRLEKLTVEKGLLRETESVQRQLNALLKCDVLENEPETEITITVFRLLVLDLLALFQVLNQGLINILGHFFEMSKPDAERAMDIYRTFTRQTDYVVAYLGVARQHEHHTRVEVPRLDHAPVNLGRQLQDYLNDPDFEIHRRQYLAEQEAKKKGGRTLTNKASKKDLAFPTPASNNPFPTSNTTNGGSKPAESKPAPAKGPDPDLIDFFDSIEQNQTTMQVQPQPQMQNMQMQQPGLQFQPTGFAPQATGFPQNNSFQQQQQNMGGFVQQQQQPVQLSPPQLQTNFTGAGFGGFTPQPQPQAQQGFQPTGLGSIPQNAVPNMQSPGTMSPVQMGQQAPFQQPQQTGQNTNPFRQSMMPQPTGMQFNPSAASSPIASPPIQGIKRQSTNPFARSGTMDSTNSFSPASNSPFQSQSQSPAPLQPMQTGTNPFTRTNTAPASMDQQRPQTAGAIQPQPTGNTNPFRQGAFVNHATGMGWQHNQQPIGGGLDQVQTMPVFPRPAQQTPWQQ